MTKFIYNDVTLDQEYDELYETLCERLKKGENFEIQDFEDFIYLTSREFEHFKEHGYSYDSFAVVDKNMELAVVNSIFNRCKTKQQQKTLWHLVEHSANIDATYRINLRSFLIKHQNLVRGKFTSSCFSPDRKGYVRNQHPYLDDYLREIQAFKNVEPYLKMKWDFVYNHERFTFLETVSSHMNSQTYDWNNHKEFWNIGYEEGNLQLQLPKDNSNLRLFEFMLNKKNVFNFNIDMFVTKFPEIYKNDPQFLLGAYLVCNLTFNVPIDQIVKHFPDMSYLQSFELTGASQILELIRPKEESLAYHFEDTSYNMV